MTKSEQLLTQILGVLIEMRDADSTAAVEGMMRRFAAEQSPIRVKEIVEASLLIDGAHKGPKGPQ